MIENIIELNGVSIIYKNIYRKPIFQRIKEFEYVESKTFKALDDITFSIKKGSTVGIIGKNGSGKTTLIRTMAGIYSPDTGTVKINTESVSMLALGVGFEISASGYDNIYLNSLLRGYSKKQVDAKIDQIIEYTGIKEFIYNPVKTYSSGMRLRLAFSIAIHFEPDVLLIDEALSVGDAEFQKKSFESMKKLITDQHRTVVIVSHSTQLLKSMCNEIMWLDKGKLKMFGPTEEVLDRYSKEAS